MLVVGVSVSFPCGLRKNDVISVCDDGKKFLISTWRSVSELLYVRLVDSLLCVLVISSEVSFVVAFAYSLCVSFRVAFDIASVVGPPSVEIVDEELLADRIALMQVSFRKNVVMSDCSCDLRFVHVIPKEELELFGVVSLSAWREHILFNELPERLLLLDRLCPFVRS